MVHIHEVSAGFMLLSAILGATLMGFAIGSYRRSHVAGLAFVAGAFMLFTIKSAFVGYAIYTRSIGHEDLELIDAVGDLGTVVLFLVPFLLPRRSPATPGSHAP